MANERENNKYIKHNRNIYKKGKKHIFCMCCVSDIEKKNDKWIACDKCVDDNWEPKKKIQMAKKLDERKKIG